MLGGKRDVEEGMVNQRNRGTMIAGIRVQEENHEGNLDAALGREINKQI